MNTPTPCDTGVLAQHQAELNAGRWRIQHCGACQRSVYFPRELCPHCGHAPLSWQTPSGLGTVYASTTVRRKAADGGDHNVSIIELDEGVRLMSRVDNGAPDAVRIGQRVRARVLVADGRGLVVFDALPDDAPVLPGADPNTAKTGSPESTPP
jgi:uncharacterized protein